MTPGVDGPTRVDGPAVTPPDAATTVDISALATSFSPATATVPTGTTVVWTNQSSAPHTVTSGTGSSAADAGALFDGDLAPGETFQFTFTTPGTYPYFCRFHEAQGMMGTITVQ